MTVEDKLGGPGEEASSIRGKKTEMDPTTQFKGLAYQATLFNLPPSGALPNAGHPRFIQTPLFSGNPLA